MVNVMDKKAPMAAAPIKYRPDGLIDWGNMWDSFCVLALEGGPPHRGTLLQSPANPDTCNETYQMGVREIVRGIEEVSGLTAESASPGWIAVYCASAGMARWLSEAIVQENVQARCQGNTLFVPVGDSFTLKGEIKNVITAVAKTTHYWQEHLAAEVKQTLALQDTFERWSGRLKNWLRM